jgi:NitT/TauT family transport system ATP-binding protein
MTALALEGVGHAYFGRTVIDRIDLTIGPGEIVALVGPSGCGKSTLIHVAAGLVEPLRGRVQRRYRRHGMVFQEPRLMPWATAAANIAYPLRISGVDARTRRRRVAAAAARVSLAAEDLAKYPVELSGGMRQRAAIARALVAEPDFVFFDEPFTALDVALKRHLQDLVIAAARDSFAALFVTHDLTEAARIAHRMVALDPAGQGIATERRLPGEPGRRGEQDIHETVQTVLREDTMFRRVYDAEERR